MVVTVIYFGIGILIVDLTTYRIPSAEWQENVWISNCREWRMNEGVVYISLKCYSGMCFVGLGKDRGKFKISFVLAAFELSSLKHKTITTVILPFFLVGHFIVVKEKE